MPAEGPTGGRSTDRSNQGWVALAEVARPHGVRGELRLKIYNQDSELLTGKPSLRLRAADGSTQAATLVTIRPVPGTLLVKLRGVNDREQAEALRGMKLEVPRELLTEVEDDEHYVVDLIGCRALHDGEELGPVVDVMAYPTCDVLVVERPPLPIDPEEVLSPRQRRKRSKPRRLEVPMQGAYLGAVDTDERTVEILTLEGLE